ncbi:MAG TPA: thioredoxin family protein [Solirubrobacteraceae bacterium]
MSATVGTEAPAFSLPDTEGVEHSPGGAPATLVVFTCNHCPYALAWHDRIAAVARDYDDVKVLAINPNDAERYPRDSYEAMRRRVADDGGWPMPYLRDESQEVARAYGARTTPDCFVLDADGRIVYRGAPDADYEDPSLDAAWLREALDAVLAGSEPATSETKPVGCSIKWKDG